MAIRCPKCGAKHDVIELQEGSSLQCGCGFKLDLSLIDSPDDFLRYCEGREELLRAKEIQRDAQTICQMILNDECPQIDIEIAKEQLEEKVKNFFPDKINTYRMIYEARFNRLWQQFRDQNGD